MLEKKIEAELKNALKSGARTKLSVLRMLTSEIRNKKIADRDKGNMDDEKVLVLIRKMARKHEESIECFEKGGRADLAEKEKEELSFLSAFLPARMSESDLVELVEGSINETGAESVKDIGAVMALAIAKAKGRADGKAISDAVRLRLGHRKDTGGSC